MRYSCAFASGVRSGTGCLVLALALSRTCPAQGQPAEPAPAPAGPASAPAAEPAAQSDSAASPVVPDTWGRTDPGPPPPLVPVPAAPAEAAASAVPPANPAPAEAPSAELADASGKVRYVLEGVEVRGNRRTRSRVVLRYVPFSPGDVIDVHDAAVVLARYRLLGTGFFRDVQFSLRKGSQRGRVILVIDVRERNTIVVNQLWMGLGADAKENEKPRPLTAYGGIGVAETNLAGTGITLGSALGIAQNQLAFRLRFYDPALAGTPLKIDSELLYNNAEDYFGNSGVRHFAPEIDVLRPFAVVDYERFGGSVGAGGDISIPAQLWLHYRLESLEASVPLAAEHDRGGALGMEPVDFDIDPGQSVLSTLSATLRFDTRDQPFLPKRGWFSQLRAEVGLSALGSDYEYQRLDLHASHFVRLPWKHVLELRGFVGAITGDPPFFEQYYINDFSELLAPRALGLNFDRRPSPNYLGTAIAEVRRGHYAAELGTEYRIPLYAGRRSVYGIDFFARFGVFVLASRRDIEDPARSWSGVARLPADLTYNLGFKADTSAGGFSFAFSNVLGFTPLR